MAEFSVIFILFASIIIALVSKPAACRRILLPDPCSSAGIAIRIATWLYIGYAAIALSMLLLRHT